MMDKKREFVAGTVVGERRRMVVGGSESFGWRESDALRFSGMCVRNAGRVSAFDGGRGVGTVSGLVGRLSDAMSRDARVIG